MKKFKFVMICGLIFILIGTVITGASYNYGKNNHQSNSITTESYAQNFDIEATNHISISNVLANVYIEKGDRFSVVAENIPEDTLHCELVNGYLNISMEENSAWINIGFIKFHLSDFSNPNFVWTDWLSTSSTWSETAKIYIYIPEGNGFNDIQINHNVGNINVDYIECETLNIWDNVGNVIINDFYTEKLELIGGVGKVDLTGIVNNDNIMINNGVGNTYLTLTEPLEANIDIYGGVGNTTINAKISGNVFIDGGVGSVKWTGAIHGDLNVDGGVGNISFDLAGNINDYNIRISEGLGSVRANNLKTDRDGYTQNVGAKYNIDIDGGVGSVQLDIN